MPVHTTAPRRPRGPGRPKDPEKRAAILAAAKRLFPLHGFDGVSMDALAAEAGVSKLTLYSHFRDKDALFIEAVKQKCEEQLPDAAFDVPPRGPLREALLRIGLQFHALVSSEDAVNLQRMMLADARNAPKLGKLFYEAGPQRVIEGFRQFLDRAVAAGALDVPDTREAAGHFLCLLKGEVNMRMLCGPQFCAHGDDPTAHVASVVEFFLRAYAPR
jgi:TetR/AcrR family transcriptional repressor of mexJK operon